MEKNDYSSFCGNYCGACEILCAYKNKTENDIAAQWGASPDEIKCHGCKSDIVFKNCNICKIRSCAMDKKIDHCVFCKEFPCKIFGSGESLVEKLPHLKSIPLNMKIISEKGLETWLKEQEKKWQCPVCGEPFTWYKEKCTVCGRELNQDKDFLNIASS
ncbi:DUF3795 domain-containing protein [Marispirochaeta sp.]|uniref:DUF3795 domain-containing protein n=1 Tax=Marispirochaeta sp. TaxID=2038653 RepID=UPI0029C81827|nr:DUF3795 domain-containing protein [Marispirochaeta sp.]